MHFTLRTEINSLTGGGETVILKSIIKGSSYRLEKKPTRIPSRRSKDPGPGHELANKTFIQAHTPGVKVFFLPLHNAGNKEPTE